MENGEMNLGKILSPDFWCYSYVLCQTYCLLHIKVPQVVVLPLPDMWVVACSHICSHHPSPISTIDGHLSSAPVPVFPSTIGSYSAGCFNALHPCKLQITCHPMCMHCNVTVISGLHGCHSSYHVINYVLYMSFNFT